jgi:predicted amidohydrolase YtcJ
MLMFYVFVLIMWSFAQKADIILTNGRIFTADSGKMYVQAIAIKGNKILATGDNASVEVYLDSSTWKIDLKGKTVVPGLNNAHDHLGWNASVGQYYRVEEFSFNGLSKNSVLDSISRLVKMAKPGQWISGDIGMTVLTDPGIRWSLDSIAPDHPVYLQTWGHGTVLNSKALNILGIHDNDRAPMGGWYGRDSEGKITGALYEYAQWPAFNAVAVSEPVNLIKSLQSYALQELKAGITTVQNMGSMIKPAMISGIFRKADLPLRVRIIPMPGTSPDGRNLNDWKDVDRHPGALSYTSGVKYLIDGSPIEQTALFKKPYQGNQNWYGRLDLPVDTITQILREALTGREQLMIHVVGDSSLSIVLSMMKELGNSETWKSKRLRIEHNPVNDNVTHAELAALKELGIIVMHTPKYNQVCKIRTLLDNEVLVGISPDGTTNPFWDIMVITSQQVNPKENITREQAVIAFTRTNAFAEFKEHEKGMLAKGMLADLAVLSQDIFTIPIEKLPTTQSVLTMVDGKIVYRTENY